MPPKFRLMIGQQRRPPPFSREASASTGVEMSQRTTDRIRALEAELAETFERIRRHL